MKAISVFLTITYSLGQITLGLLLHPYQTMQMLVEDRVFVWMTLLPSGVLGLVTIFWRWVIVPTVRLVFSCQTSQVAACDWLPFWANWLTLFCLYWQIILIYLLFRFNSVYRTQA